MAIFLRVSAAPKRILLSKISYAPVQHSLSQPESFIVTWFLVHGWKQFLDSMNENVNIMCFGENAFKQQRII